VFGTYTYANFPLDNSSTFLRLLSTQSILRKPLSLEVGVISMVLAPFSDGLSLTFIKISLPAVCSNN